MLASNREKVFFYFFSRARKPGAFFRGFAETAMLAGALTAGKKSGEKTRRSRTAGKRKTTIL
jgi:hypothetical protein